MSATFTVNDACAIVVDPENGMRPESQRTGTLALRKYAVLFDSQDIVSAYERLGSVRDRFADVLAEHSVKHYITAIMEVARLPAVQARLRECRPETWDAIMESATVVEDECKKLSNKVPRRGRRPTPTEADDTGPTEGPAESSAYDTEVAVLRTRIECMQDRINDLHRMMELMFNALAADHRRQM